MSNREKSAHYGSLQKVVDYLFSEDPAGSAGATDGAVRTGVDPEEEPFEVARLDVVIAAESADLPDDLMRIITLLPPGNYTRERLTNQLNSAICGHAWGQVYGTVS